MTPVQWLGFLALIALLVVTIVLLCRGTSNVAQQSSYKFALKTHFVDPLQVPAHASPESAGLSARSEVNTQTEVPNLNSNASVIFDQGNLGSCVANALVGAFDYVDTSPLGSRLFLQQNARSVDGNVNGDTGTSLWAGIQSLQRWGLAYETSWPQKTSQQRKRPNTTVQTQAKTNRVVQAYRVAVGISSVTNWISKGYPVAVGLLLQRSFLNVGTTGIVTMPRPKEPLLGGHAVLIVGYDNTLRRFKVRNSWGTSWGLGGYFWLPQDYLNQNLASDFWVITTTT